MQSIPALVFSLLMLASFTCCDTPEPELSEGLTYRAGEYYDEYNLRYTLNIRLNQPPQYKDLEIISAALINQRDSNAFYKMYFYIPSRKRPYARVDSPPLVIQELPDEE